MATGVRRGVLPALLLSLLVAGCAVDRGTRACPADLSDRYRCPEIQRNTIANPVYQCLQDGAGLTLVEIDECPVGTFCAVREEATRYTCVDASGLAITGASLRTEPHQPTSP